MAYQTRGGDPLFDSDMQAALEKRGKELLGFGLIALGLMAAAMVMSYHPEDPSFMSATDAPVQNWLGRMGASIAAPLFMIIGWGSWALAIVLGGWGLRFALHRGADRAIGRLVFAPIWIAALAVYASTLVPGPTWTHSFGLGGLFGDTVLGVLLGILPGGSGFGLKLLSLVMAVLVLALGAFVMGFTRPEIARLARFLMLSVVMTYATLMTVLGRGANGAMNGAAALKSRSNERRTTRAHSGSIISAWAQSPEQTDWNDAGYDQYATDPQPQDAMEPITKPGLLSRVPGLIRRADPMPEPELVEPHSLDFADDFADTEFGGDRIKGKISEAIKARVRSNAVGLGAATAVGTSVAAAAVAARKRGPQALVLNTDRAKAPMLPPEPPVTARTPGLRAEPMLTRAAPPAPTAPAPMAPTAAYAADEFDTFDDYTTYSDDDAVDIDAVNMFAPEYDAADFAADDGYEPLTDTYEPLDPPVVPASIPRAAIPVAEPKRVVQHAPRKPVLPSTRAKAEAQPALNFDGKQSEYELPPLSLLSNPANIKRYALSDESLEENARMLESVLDDYGVKGEIVSVRPGPVVTMYELEPAPGLKASRVIGLADDIARSMSALSARVSTVPGRSVIGIELPNDNREMVSFREILSSRDYGDSNMKLPLALGKDIGGDPIVANLAKMPHLLIAGTTGSGKSVAINTMILSLLYRLTPEDCRLIMIDPKMLELSVYDGIPHLLSPVVTDPKKAVVALKWAVGEMEDRYRKMSKMGVRNIDGYNGRVAEALAKGEMFSRTVQTGFDDETGEPIFESDEFAPEKMPYIVVIVDEMADLMMVAGKEIEACIQRLAQMARASGIHLIMATQRPSVDVITGTIKANFPSRISFQVTSKIDSRTILGEMGAEQLLGMGDMLYMAGGAKITRCHGPFVSDEEVEEIVNHLKAYGPPVYMNSVLEGPDDDREADIDAVLGLNTGGNTDMEDALYDTAVAIVIKDRKCSTSYIQRKLAIGYNKAARLVEQMEDNNVVSAANHVGKREVLIPEQ